MSGSSVPSTLKRKRFCFSKISAGSDITEELLQIASVFASSTVEAESLWLSSAATKLPVQSVTGDMLLVYPEEKGDDKETINDEWAMTSNWVYYTVKSKDDTFMTIKILGAMFESDNDIKVGELLTVKYPQYLLVTKNDTEVAGRKLIVENQSKEGETVQVEKIVKIVSLYGIRDLDNNPRECSLKNEGIKRMIKVAGIIRLMGMDRFERLIVDLLYCRRTFNDTVERYVASSLTLPEDSIFKTFVKRPNLKGLAIIDDVDKFEKFLLGDYPLYDRSGISLSDFIRHRSLPYVWGNTPTREGRTMLVDAFTNFQKVLVVFYGTHYNNCCEDVVEVLEENADVLRKFNDSFLQVKFEMVLSQFFQDIYKEKNSLVYSSMSMDTPVRCAALLKTYLSEEVKCARGLQGDERNWELHPHSFFYSVEGEFNKNIFTKAARKEEVRAEARSTSNKSKVENEICIWYLGSLLQVEMNNGKEVECRNKETCSRIHKPLNQTTKKEANMVVDKMNNSKLKTSFEKKMISVTGFKKLGVAFK